MDVFDLVAKITLDSSEYEKGLGNARDKASGFGSALGTVAKVGTAAIAAATTAAVGFAGQAVKVGAEFDSSMSQVAATLGYTVSDIENNVNGAGDAFDELRDKAREMGGSTIYSASEAAEGLNILAMSGYDAAESMSMIEDVLHLAAAGSMDMASAAGYVSGVMKGFNDETKDSGYYADLMAKGATLANTSVAQLGEAMSSGAAGAAAYGQSADSMTIALLRLAEQGESGAAAGTALAAAMKNLYTPTDQARKVLSDLGINAFDPATGKARDFNTVVNELDSALSGYTEEQQAAYKQTIFGIQGLDAYNKMTVTGIDKQEEWAEALAGASEGAGEAAKQYDTMTNNLQGAIAGWGSALSDLQIEISDQLTPAFTDFINFGTEGLQRITAAFQEGGLSGAMDAFGSVLSDGLTMVLEELPKFVEAGTQLILALVQGVAENLPMLLESGVQVITTLITGIAESLPTLIPTMWQAVFNMVQGLLDNVDLLIDAAIELIKGLVEGVINGIPLLIEAAPQIIAGLASALVEAIPALLSAAGEIMTSIGQALYDAAPESLQDVIDAIGNAFESAWEAIQAVWELVEPFFEAIWEAIKAIWSVVAPFFEAIFKSAWEGIKGVWDVATSFFQTVWDVIAGIFSVVASVLTGDFRGAWEGIKGIWSSVGSFFSGVWNTIKGVFSAVGSFFGNAFRTAVNNIKSAFGNIVSFFQGKWNSIKNVFSNAGSWFRQVGSSIVNGIKGGISAGWQALTNWVAEKARSLLNAAKAALGIASPSKAFRDEVGKMITLGIADGIVSKDAMRALDTATAELTGDSVKDLEKMVKAWDDVYKSYYEGLEHQNFFLELAGDTDAIIANYRKMQETLHEQKEHYLRMGVDANDSAIRDMEEQWWAYQDKIDGVYDGIAKKAEQTYDTMIDVMEHKLFLSEKQGKGPEERLAILEQLMEETHKRAETLRAQGYTDDSKEIRELQKQWWGYHDDVEDINEDIAKGIKERNDKIADAMKKSVSDTADIFMELAETAQKAYDEAFDAIMDKQKAMQDKLAGYGELYKSTTTTSGRTYVSLQDLDRQTKQLERYGEIIEELRSRGVSGSLMEDILGMGVDEGSAFGKRLLSMSEGGLNDYLASYQRKQDIAADISARYYKPEFDALNGQNTEMTVAQQQNLEYSEEQVSLLRRITEAFESSTGQVVQVIVDGQVIANATFDDLVMVGKQRGRDIVNVKEG